ncbi:GNAT family N-acetyltransferase [Clostridium sp.]|uniref:GNAT family N-acetyltransferase n=1 Tax=Clostridium sp. TaxID=1506 RepID=UPI00346480C6
MNLEYKARKMRTEDLNSCAELMIKVYNGAPWFDQWESVEQSSKYLKEFMDNPAFRGFVIEKEDIIVGACFGHKRSWFSGDECFVNEYFIDNDYQSIGLGSKLMNFVKLSLKEENIIYITLLTERNIPAKDFYEKQGLKIKEENIFMYGEC